MSSPLYLVTGAMGHLGNIVIGKLRQQGAQVRGLALPADHSVPCFDPGVEIVRGDVRDLESLVPFFAHKIVQELVVIHTAGIVSISSKYQQRLYDVNVQGTKNILKLCVLNHVKKLVHVSSVHAIPELEKGKVITEVSSFQPEEVHGPYAKTKSEASQAVLDAVTQYGLNASIVHPSGILGPGDFGRGHLTQLVIDYLNGRLTACVKGGYDFVDVRDVADGILSCVENGQPGECYILSNQYFPVKEILDTLHDITGKKKLKTVLPLWFAKATAPLSEIYYKILKQPPLYTSYSLYTLESNAAFSHAKATRELNYQPRPIKETLCDTARWLQEHQRIKNKLSLQWNP